MQNEVDSLCLHESHERPALRLGLRSFDSREPRRAQRRRPHHRPRRVRFPHRGSDNQVPPSLARCACRARTRDTRRARREAPWRRARRDLTGARTGTGTGARTCAGTQAQRAQAPAHQAQESARHVHTHMHMRVGDFMDIWCQAFRAQRSSVRGGQCRTADVDESAADRDFRLSAANPRPGSNVIPQGVQGRACSSNVMATWLLIV